MAELSSSIDAARLTQRVQMLRAQSPPQWGVMTAGEMVVHCADQMRVCRGQKAVTSTSVPRLLRPIVKWIFVMRRKEFKPGMKTLKELDARAAMTPPTTFEDDKQTLLTLMKEPGGGVVDHPLFGSLTPEEAQELSLRHLEYHLRQFGA